MEKFIKFYYLTPWEMKKSDLKKLCMELLVAKEDLSKARKVVRTLVKEKQDIEEKIEKELYWIAEREINISYKK